MNFRSSGSDGSVRSVRSARSIVWACVASAALLVTVPAPKAQTQAPNTLSAEETVAGFRLLFDGKTIDKWRGYKQKNVPAGWQVVDGAITRVAGGPDLISVDQYSAFDFRFEWMVTPGQNSGVMFFVTEANEATYMSGPEYQVLDNALHPDGKDPLTSAAACYALYAPPKDVTRPVGQWNEGRIVVDASRRVEHWLNGTRTVQYQMGSPEWNKLVAASKFKDWPPFGLATRGHLAIQEHGGHVAFRNLRIKAQ